MNTPPGGQPHPDPADQPRQPDQGGWPPPPQQQPYQQGPGQTPGYQQYGQPDPTQQYAPPPPGYPAPAYAGGGTYTGDPAAPYGYDPMGRPYSDKQKLLAGLLGILLGWLGAGRFYTGHTGLGVAQLAVSLVTCGAGGIWGLIDGILILVNGGTDAEGRPLRD
jgi:TM2 domain-containing membrane protein YozV